MAGLCVFALPTRAVAQPASPDAARERELIQIDYQADAGCPRFDAFVEKVRVYTTRWTLASEGDKARRFRLKLEPRDGRVMGTLEVVQIRSGGSDANASRTITGPDCETVARGMAVAVAVAIDPAALLSAPPAPPEDPSASPAPPPPPPPSPPVPIERPPTFRPRPKRRPPEAPRFALEARIELTSAVVVGYVPVFSAALEVEPFARSAQDPSWSLPRWLRPSVAIGVRQSAPRGVERSTVTTDFLWSAALLRLCPVRFSTARDRFEATPCFEGDLGVLQADASGSSDARRTSKLWLDAGVSAHARWTVSGPWFLGGAVFMVLPLSRNRFELATGTLVSRAPRVGITFGITGGLRF